MRTWTRVGALAALSSLAVVAACSSDSVRPGNLFGDAGAFDGSSSGALGDAGGDVAQLSYVCGPGAAWEEAKLPLTGRVGSITPDDRTLVWTAPEGGGTRIFFAERNGTDESFQATEQLAVDPATVADDRVAITPDGLSIAFLVKTQDAFAQVTRSARVIAFGPVSRDGFANINFENRETRPPAGSGLGDAVWAPSTSFFFSEYGPNRTATVISTEPKDLTTLLDFGDSELLPVGDKRRRPTGVAADEHTLFYWDETTQSEKVAFRAPGADRRFVRFEDLGDRRGAVPNATCTRLYFSRAGAGGVDEIWVAKRK